MEDSGSQDNLMSDINLHDLEWALISFALQPRRLFLIDRPTCWLNFHSASQENMDKYWEYTTEELCEMFLKEVLVRIENYDLNTEEEYMIKLLELHPNFVRTEYGFVRKYEMERIDFCRQHVNDGSSSRIAAPHKSPDDFLMEDAGNDLNCQIVLAPNDADSLTEHRSAFQLSSENAALFSVALNPDSSMPLCKRLTELEIKKYLREAKILFAQSGLQLDNIDITINGILEKLRTLSDLKEIVLELVSEFSE